MLGPEPGYSKVVCGIFTAMAKCLLLDRKLCLENCSVPRQKLKLIPEVYLVPSNHFLSYGEGHGHLAQWPEYLGSELSAQL